MDKNKPRGRNPLSAVKPAYGSDKPRGMGSEGVHMGMDQLKRFQAQDKEIKAKAKAAVERRMREDAMAEAEEKSKREGAQAKVGEVEVEEVVAERKAEKSWEPPSDVPPMVRPAGMSDEEWREVFAMQHFLDGTSFELEANRERYEFMTKSLQRNRELEERLGPIDPMQIWNDPWVSQIVPVAPGRELVFLTTPSVVAVEGERVANKVKGYWGAEGNLSHNESMIYRVMLLSLSLASVGGRQPWPEDVPRMVKDCVDVWTGGGDMDLVHRRMEANLRWWLTKDNQFIADLLVLHAGFTFRIRKAMALDGLAEESVGK